MAMLIAITVVIARFLLIPVPGTHGNINLCDAGIFISALVLGRSQGAIVGALSGLLLDLISGYTQYMFFSFLIYGLEGFVVGWIGLNHSRYARFIAMALGVIVMVGGYWMADSLLYGMKIGLLGVPTNFIQGIAGFIVTSIVYIPLKKIYLKQIIKLIKLIT